MAVAAAIVVALGLAGAFAAGRLTGGGGTPATTSAEAGFARDMRVHHIQAVEMSLIIRDLTDDADTRLLAYDIATSQGQQSGQMFGWLALWGLPQADAEPSMTWMTRAPIVDGGGQGASHDGMDMGSEESSGGAHTPGAPMPGFATSAQLTTLKNLTGIAAERYFLELMIAHHVGGVEMAQAVLERSTERVVVNLARSIVASQESELGLMRDMLAERETR